MVDTRASLTRTELDWLVMALNHHIADIQKEVDGAKDVLGVTLGQMAIDGRTNLRTKLTDIIMSGRKTITIK